MASSQLVAQTSAATSTTSVCQMTESSTETTAATAAGTPLGSSNSMHQFELEANGCREVAARLKAGGLAHGFSPAIGDKTAQQASSDECRADLSCWWRRTRIHVALLGLAIAVVNCYAQATFCIAIVEMVLPADYALVKTPPPPTSATLNAMTQPTPTSSSSNATLSSGLPLLGGLPLGLLLSDAPTAPGDNSCPIEFKYRDYYDTWRFPTTTSARAFHNASLQTNGTNTRSSQQQQASANSLNVDASNRFNWDASQQGLLLGAFAFGTAPLQIVGGRLAEIYGSKWVLLLGCIGTALTNLTIPHIAHFSFLLLLVNRIFMGVAQAGMEPGLMCLLAEWLTPQEAGFFISMLLFAICLGFFLGSLCSSLILGLGFGWPLAYYVTGALNLAVGLVWYVYADSRPHDSRFICKRELEHIQQAQKRHKASSSSSSSSSGGQLNDSTLTFHNNDDKLQDLKKAGGSQQGAAFVINGAGPPQTRSEETFVIGVVDDELHKTKNNNNDKQQQVIDEKQQQLVESANAPWRNILATRSVWAFIICKISVRWCADVISNELPTYLANVLHLSIKVNGLFNSISTALFMISSFLTGWLVSELSILENNTTNQSPLAKLARNKTRVRKLFQSIASFGSAICLVLMSQYDCDIDFSMSMLLVLSCCLVMGTGGELQIPYDMTARYPGTLHGMACTLSVSGWLAPPLIGLVLGDQPSSRHRWSLVWYSTAAITLIGGLAFVLFADSSPRDFDSNSIPKQQRRTIGGWRKRLRRRRQLSISGVLSEKVIDPSASNKAGRKPSETSLCSAITTTNPHHIMSDLDHFTNPAKGYVNGALNSSSCEGSPKAIHSLGTDNNLYLLQHELDEEGDHLRSAGKTPTQYSCAQTATGGGGGGGCREAHAAEAPRGASNAHVVAPPFDRFGKVDLASELQQTRAAPAILSGALIEDRHDQHRTTATLETKTPPTMINDATRRELIVDRPPPADKRAAPPATATDLNKPAAAAAAQPAAKGGDQQQRQQWQAPAAHYSPPAAGELQQTITHL